MHQQRDLERVQFQGQLAIEDNINRVIEEKKLIAESHRQLVELSEAVKQKIEQASTQLDSHQEESRANHAELLDDLISIQNKAHVIFQRIGLLKSSCVLFLFAHHFIFRGFLKVAARAK